MTDTVDKETRSRIMASIKPKGNRSTEVAMMHILRSSKLRGWRRHYPVVGTPDFCWPSLKIALHVDGCFWHGCPYCNKRAKSNTDFWEAKISRNMRRDKKVAKQLRRIGWCVLRVWECRLTLPVTQNRIKRAYQTRLTNIRLNRG